MKILVCSTNVPHAEAFPGLSASMMTLYGYVETLRDAGHEILHFIAADEKQLNQEVLRKYKAAMPDVHVLVWSVPSLVAPRKHSWDPIIPRTLPQDIRDEITAFGPDAAFSLDVFAASVLRGFHPAPMLVQVHDPKFQTLWYHAVFEAREHPKHLLRLPMDWWRQRLWRNFYRDTLKEAASVIAIAGTTLPELRKMGVQAHYVPMSWPPPKAQPDLDPKLPAKPTYLFLGNLSGLGSRSALHFLFEGVYPEMRRRFGDGGFSLIICGAHNANAWAMDHIRSKPEIDFRGFVDDIDTLMLGCHAVIAPIDVKVGNRTRILTAMSLGVLTVCHDNTALGNLSLKDGETCYLASDPKTFVEKMETAFRRPPEVATIVRNALKAFNDNYHPKAAGAFLLKEIEAMVA